MQQVNDKRFYRGSDRILGGVCSGLAEGLHLDPLWIRILFVLLIFVQGVGVFVYVVLWLVMPERTEGGATRVGFDSMADDLKRVSRNLQSQFGSSAPRPESPTSTSPSAGSPPAASPGPIEARGAAWHQQPSLLGLILVVVGLVVLGTNLGVINWSVVWPAALITVGIVLLIRNLERRP